MKKTRFHKLFRYHVRRLAYNIKLLRVLKSISREKYDEKVSASLLYGFLSAIAVNFFFQPGHVYSSGATGLAQILSVLSQRFIGFTIPVSLTFYAINIPLMIVAWYQIGHKFTIFTFIGFDEFPLYSVRASDYVDQRSDHECPIWWGCHGNRNWFCSSEQHFQWGNGYCQFDDSKTDRKECRQYLLFGQWDHYVDCWSDLWLEVCSLLYDYHLCIESSNGCCLYQAKTDAGNDRNEPAGCHY